MNKAHELSRFFAEAIPGATKTKVLLEICRRDPDFLYDCIKTVGAPTWEQEAEALLRADRKIHAIKSCRNRTGWPLKDAKTAVEALQKELGL